MLKLLQYVVQFGFLQRVLKFIFFCFQSLVSVDIQVVVYFAFILVMTEALLVPLVLRSQPLFEDGLPVGAHLLGVC